MPVEPHNPERNQQSDSKQPAAEETVVEPAGDIEFGVDFDVQPRWSGNALQSNSDNSLPGAFFVRGSNSGGRNEATPSSLISGNATDLPIAAEVADGGDDDSKAVVASKMSDVVCNFKSWKVRVATALFLVVIIAAAVGAVYGTRKKTRENAESLLESCIVDDPSKLGNGECDEKYNTKKCSWDNGDCIILNKYPDCVLTPVESPKLGDGVCDGYPLFSKQCGYDDGDCENCTVPAIWYGQLTRASFETQVGDGVCNGPLNHKGCGYDGGDCLGFNEKYPDCRMGDLSCSSFNATYPGCVIPYPEWIGDGGCDAEGYNNIRCGYDGGDCAKWNEIYNREYPDCLGGDGSCKSFNESLPGCLVEDPQFLGDGGCDGGSYNSAECLWDLGDCDWVNEAYPDCHWGNMTCSLFRKQYPDCDVEKPFFLGDGECDGLPYASASCGYDGGDCTACEFIGEVCNEQE